MIIGKKRRQTIIIASPRAAFDVIVSDLVCIIPKPFQSLKLALTQLNQRKSPGFSQGFVHFCTAQCSVS
jgi:hypothetical protein